MSNSSSNLYTVLLQVLIKGLVLFTALPVHECAHAWVAERLGDTTGREQGRITLNPLVHLDLFGAVAMLLTGFGWARPVPVDARKFKNPKWGMALTSFAGPVSNLLLSILWMIVYKVLAYLLPATADLGIYFASIIYYMVLLNIGLAIFNLLPIPPLDGSRILTLFLPQKLYFRVMRYEQFVFIGLILLMFTGLLDGPMSFLRQYTLLGINWLTGFVDIIMKAVM